MWTQIRNVDTNQNVYTNSSENKNVDTKVEMWTQIGVGRV